MISRGVGEAVITRGVGEEGRWEGQEWIGDGGDGRSWLGQERKWAGKDYFSRWAGHHCSRRKDSVQGMAGKGGEVGRP